jgi:hypothetical protein
VLFFFFSKYKQKLNIHFQIKNILKHCFNHPENKPAVIFCHFHQTIIFASFFLSWCSTLRSNILFSDNTFFLE